MKLIVDLVFIFIILFIFSVVFFVIVVERVKCVNIVSMSVIEKIFFIIFVDVII